VRSTVIICTSIPISIIGTFALLYFFGFTLNTMTFGGLALGVGMIVDASIVVLENSYRHMEQLGKDRMQASIDGSEEVWSASSRRRPISRCSCRSSSSRRLERPLPQLPRRDFSRWPFGAVTVPVRSGLRCRRRPAEKPQGGVLGASGVHNSTTRRLLHKLHHRPASSAARRSAVASLIPRSRRNAAQSDEGEVSERRMPKEPDRATDAVSTAEESGPSCPSR
jgi:hypothetical protein